MADKRAYFTLDVGYLMNPKIAPLLDAQPRAVLLHIQCIAYAAQHLTDGVVPMLLAMRLACAEQCDLDALVQCGLLEDLGNGTVAVHDYLEHQRSASAVKRASDKAKLAARSRWDDAPSNAPSMPDALPDAMPREKERKREELQPDRTPRKRGSRVPDDFAVTAEMTTWAASKAPDVHIETATEDFIDYWKSVAGEKGVKLDWVATWRTSMRKQQKWAEERKPITTPGTSFWDRKPTHD